MIEGRMRSNGQLRAEPARVTKRPLSVEILRLGVTDRVMVIAPHPDDETLATGGLLQSALAAGAAVRICYVTDGDNNPWAQLVTEARWPLRAADRARWGQRRRREALAALARLGVSEEQVVVFGFHDQGLTELLLKGDDEPVRAIAGAIDSWRPTVLVVPSPSDAHPDHSATSVHAHFALASLEIQHRGRLLHYQIHPEPDRTRGRLLVRLDDVAQSRKRQAVLCHRSQLTWRGRQFLGQVRGSERFEVASEPQADDEARTVYSASFSRGALHMEFECRERVHWGPAVMHVAFVTRTGRHGRVSIVHPSRARSGMVREALTGTTVGLVSSRSGARAVSLNLALEEFASPSLCFVKLEWPAERRLGLFNSDGWRAVPVPPLPLQSRPTMSRKARGSEAIHHADSEKAGRTS